MKSSNGVRRQSRLWLAAAALTVLAACGGGTAQIEPFAPTRIISFGDEASLITSDGKKYTTNGLNATTLVRDCTVNPIWVQSLASVFGLAFPQCNPNPLNAITPTGLMYATAGGQVADVKLKIDQHFAVSGFNPKDLVTIMVGANDVLEVYKRFPAQSEASVTEEVRARGRLLAAQINRIANAGGRVIISTLPDMGLTPYAIQQKAANIDTDRAALLSRLTVEFNVAMRLDIINDGRLIGLVLLDETIQAAVRFPGNFNLVNATEAACLATVAIQDCTSATLVTGASADTWLWASDTLLSAKGQALLASLAQTRAQNNPF